MRSGAISSILSTRCTGWTGFTFGSIGDYGQMYIFAEGYIDSVRLTTPSTVTPVPTFAATLTQTPAPGSALTKVTTHKPTLTVPTPYPTATPQSPLPGVLAIAALGIAALCRLASSGRERNNFFPCSPILKIPPGLRAEVFFPVCAARDLSVRFEELPDDKHCRERKGSGQRFMAILFTVTGAGRS